jgi:hypothetical protein
MITLARLHAALDSVVETEQLIAAIQDGAAIAPPSVGRVGALLGEAREVLRWLLARPENRHAAEPAVTRRNSGGHDR